MKLIWDIIYIGTGLLFIPFAWRLCRELRDERDK